jgi:urease alpha subunit
LVAISVIALALVTTTSFNHSYTALATPKKAGSTASHANNITTLGGGGGGASSSSAATTTAPNTNALTKKELSSLISCINTANKSQGLTHKVVTNCLDIARGRLLLPLPQVVVPHQ